MQLHIHIEANAVMEQLAEFPATLRQAIERGLERATKLLRGAVETNIRSPFGRKSPAVAFGVLADSVTRELYDENGLQVGRVFLAPPADRYGLLVETGARPHMPPVSALIPWVQVKFGLRELKAIRSAAWAVASRIKQRGAAGHFMFERAYEENFGRVVSLLEEEVDRSLSGRN